MIRVHQHPDETAYTSRGCPWIAECELNGVAYSAKSRSGAPYALARILVAAGIPDMPMVVTARGAKGEMRYRSFYAMAGYTIGESATHPVHRAQWEAYGGGAAFKMPQSSPAAGPKQGSEAVLGVAVAAEV